MKAILTLGLALTVTIAFGQKKSDRLNVVLMPADNAGYDDISACNLDIRDGLIKFKMR